ncbi:hypothetical protein D3C71_1574780 [compost metagenome]
MFAHQAGIDRLDEQLHLNRALIHGQGIAFHPTHLDLFVEHRTVAVQRTEALGLQGQVQARPIIR